MDDVLNWLLDDETPEVKYRTMIELLGMSKAEPEVKEAHTSLMRSQSLALIMEKLGLNKKWDAINAFLAIPEMGLTRNDVPIDRNVDFIIKHMNMSTKCARVLFLRNLVSLGFSDHPWVEEQISLLFPTIRQDGSVRCLDKGKRTNDSKLPDMGCYRQTTTYLLLAAELKKKNTILPEFDLLKRFYWDHAVAFRPESPETPIIKEMAGTFFPIDHVHIGLPIILYGLSILGGADHPSCSKAWALLERERDREGRYRLTESFGEPYFDVGVVGQPNKWVTLYVLLAKKYRSQGDGIGSSHR